MRSFLLRMLALPLVLLLMAPLALHAQTSATITSGNGEGTYTIEFLGIVAMATAPIPGPTGSPRSPEKT